MAGGERHVQSESLKTFELSRGSFSPPGSGPIPEGRTSAAGCERPVPTARTTMEHMTELPRLAEADGVFFLTLAKGDRTSIATTIQRLIDMLDAMEPNPDLEDSADSWFDEDFEETGDDEPALAAAERHPGVGWGFGRENEAARREHSQDDWACGDSSGEDREDDDERELVSEDEGSVSGDEEYSLGWQDEGSQETLNMWGEYEADLGTTEELDQVRRIEVSEEWQCDDGEPDLGFVGHGTGWREGEETERGFLGGWPGNGDGHRIAEQMLRGVLIPEMSTRH